MRWLESISPVRLLRPVHLLGVRNSIITRNHHCLAIPKKLYESWSDPIHSSCINTQGFPGLAAIIIVNALVFRNQMNVCAEPLRTAHLDQQLVCTLGTVASSPIVVGKNALTGLADGSSPI